MAITKGKTFTDNEQVTAGKLHTLVDDATIDALAVDTAQLADDAVTNAKIAAAAGIVLSKITAAKDKLVGGSTSDTAESVTVGAGLSLSGSALTVPTDGVVTTMIADDNVTVDKLANTLTYGASAVVDYSAASALTLKTGSVKYTDLVTGGMTAVGEATPASGDYVLFQDINNSDLTRRATIADAVAAAGTDFSSATAAASAVTAGKNTLVSAHGYAAAPSYAKAVLVCTSAADGYAEDDEVDLTVLTNGGTDSPHLSVMSDATGIYLLRANSSPAGFSITSTSYSTTTWAAVYAIFGTIKVYYKE